MELSDAELVAQAQTGAEAALTALFARYRAPLYAYFNRLTRPDFHLADDLFQKLWVQIIEKIKQCRDGAQFRFWALAMAKNLWLQHLRYKKIRDKILFFLPPEKLPDFPVPPPNFVDDDDEPPPENLAAKVEAILATLPPEQVEVFTLRQNGLSFKEIAALQKCPLNTALSRMRYLIATVREKLELPS